MKICFYKLNDRFIPQRQFCLPNGKPISLQFYLTFRHSNLFQGGLDFQLFRRLQLGTVNQSQLLILPWIKVEILTGHVTFKSCYNFWKSRRKQPCTAYHILLLWSEQDFRVFVVNAFSTMHHKQYICHHYIVLRQWYIKIDQHYNQCISISCSPTSIETIVIEL